MDTLEVVVTVILPVFIVHGVIVSLNTDILDMPDGLVVINRGGAIEEAILNQFLVIGRLHDEVLHLLPFK